jgi:hypothetical protein
MAVDSVGGSFRGHFAAWMVVVNVAAMVFFSLLLSGLFAVYVRHDPRCSPRVVGAVRQRGDSFRNELEQFDVIDYSDRAPPLAGSGHRNQVATGQFERRLHLSHPTSDCGFVGRIKRRAVQNTPQGVLNRYALKMQRRMLPVSR